MVISKSFRCHMELPFKSYLTQILMQRAWELVGSTDMSIQQKEKPA